MSLTLFIDTETDGFALMDKPRTDPGQPHIVSIAAILAEEDGTERGCMSAIIRPDGFTIDPESEAAKINGITQELAEAYGVGLRRAMLLFAELYQHADRMVAHNLPFDDKMLRITFERLQGYPKSEPREKFCTANKATKIVNLPPSEKMVAKGMKMPKTPNLAECWQFFFGEPLPAGAHGAMFDARACQRIYYAIRERTDGIPSAIKASMARAAASADAYTKEADARQEANRAFAEGKQWPDDIIKPQPRPAAPSGEFDPNDPFGEGAR